VLLPHRFELAESAGPEDRPLDRWSRIFGPVFEVASSLDELAEVSGDFVGYATSQFILTLTSISSVRLTRSPEMIVRGGFDQFGVRLVGSEGPAGLAGGRTVDAHAGDVIFFDLLQPFSFHLLAQPDSPAEVILWIPRPKVLSAFNDETALHGLVVRATSPAGALVGAALRCLGEIAPLVTRREMDSLTDGVVALSARAVAAALEEAGTQAGTAPPASFVAVRRFIDRNLTATGLNADMVAKSFGLSRATVYRLFEHTGGIANYVRKIRLERAYKEVTTPALADLRIGQIAYSLGFKNVSAFNRLFLRTYGISPGEARKRRVTPAALAPASETPSLGYWLRQLQ
jgi:AraC-like DNA-binding protein